MIALAAAAAPAPPPAATLRLVSDRVLPKGLDKAEDVRWASDRTVFLALVKDGTVEASVEPGGPAPREMIPGKNTLGGWFLSARLGCSSHYLVVGAPLWGLTWRTLDQPLRKESVFEGIEDLDVSGNRLLVLGARRDDNRKFAPDGAIAWIGSLDTDLSDLRAVLFDSSGPGARNMASCFLFEMGAVRFLAGGSFIVVPGVQPGAHLYDSRAKLVRTWDTAGLGLDSDCATISREQMFKLAADFDARVAWLNRRRTLDEILPLPQGPGLVIRNVADGRPRWQLKVLRESGEITTYEIPLASESGRSHLRGDVRGGRIVLLLYSLEEDMRTGRRAPSRLVLAEVPGH